MSDLQTSEHLNQSIGSAWVPPFRGEIYEYASKLDLQSGYAVKGCFDIATLRHLVEPLQAIRDPRVRVVSIRGAVQTTKSLLADIVVPYWIEHDPGDTLWLLEDDPKAKLYAETRAMPLIRSIPGIAALLQGIDASEKTKTKIKFKHMNLVIAGLNPGNVQSISYRYVIIDETWLHPYDGLIRQAMDRTKQYPHTKKIILIGQGGEEDDDPDQIHKQTDMRELQYVCPFCGEVQPFELSRLREGEIRDSCNSSLRELVPPELKDTYSGLAWDTNETTRPNGRWHYGEVAKTAHHRCYKCDGRIEDTPEMRRRLNDSYSYKATNPLAPPELVGFHWSGEASMRVSFAELVTKYLRAKTAAEEQGYKLPLKEYYQKDRGLSWSEMLEADYRAVVRETYDVHAEWGEESFRPMIVDCQKDLKKFYAGVFGVSLSGEVRELARITASNWAELAKLQADWKVKDQHVLVDCGYQMTKVLRECVQHGHVGQIKVGGKPRKIWLCWTGMKGSGQQLFCHVNPATEAKEWRIYSPRKFYDTNIGTDARQPRSPWYEWSNLHCKDLLVARRDGDPGVPKFLTLPDTLPATDQYSHFAQMRSEKRAEYYKGGAKRAIWELIKESRPNHEWDKGAMLMGFMGIVGIIGSPEGASEPADQAAEASAAPAAG